MAISSLLVRSLDLLVPSACAACELPGAPLCRECLDALERPPPPLCACCGHPTPIPVERCPRCPPRLDRSSQAVVYAGPAVAVVSSLKDGRRRVLARVMAAYMAAALAPPAENAVLVPVPLAPSRLAERGFNQALLLARELGRRWRREVAEPLVRRADGPAQRGSSATERMLQVRGAFAARGEVMPERLVLVDDVHTTGATLAACALAARRGGAREVTAVSFARTVAGRVGS